MRITLLIALLAVFTLPTTAQTKRKLKKEMNSFMGATKQQLLLAYGPPSRVAPDAGTGEIVIFSHTQTEAIPILRNNPYTNSLEIASTRYNQYYVHKMYFVNANGIVYAWLWQKNPNPPQQLDLNLNANVNVSNR